MSNRKGRNFYIQTETLLGTSLVPKGNLLQEQLDKNAKSIASYITKMKEEKDVIKRRSITREPVELRIMYIPFVKKRKETFEEALSNHEEKVRKEMLKIQEQHNKKYQDRLSIIVENVNDIKKSSIKKEFRNL